MRPAAGSLANAAHSHTPASHNRARTAAASGDGANNKAAVMAVPKIRAVTIRAASMMERFARSELHDLGFLVLQQRVDGRHVAVGELLDLFLATALVVLRDHLLFQQLFEIAKRLAPHAAQADTPCLRMRAHDF